MPLLDGPPARWVPLAERSISLLREHQHPSNAWPASPHFSPYRYSWFRDGALIADGASGAGLEAEAERVGGEPRRDARRHPGSGHGRPPGRRAAGCDRPGLRRGGALPLTDPLVVRTVAAVEQQLTDGGVHRYRADIP